MKLAHRAFLLPALIIVLLGATGVAGCGGSSDDSDSTAATPSTASQSFALEELGIELAPAPKGEAGALVHSLQEDSDDSLLQAGDLIVMVNRRPVADVAAVERTLRHTPLGGSLPLTVMRGSRRYDFTEVLSPVAYLGASIQDRKGRVTVVAVHDGSPAAAAGLRRGDAILAIDGTPVPTAPDLLDALGTHSPGDTVTVEVKRGSRQIELEATLAEQP